MAFLGSAGLRLGVGMLLAAVAGCGSSNGASNASSDGLPDASSDVSPGPSIQEQRSSVTRDTTPDISAEDYVRFIAGTNQFGRSGLLAGEHGGCAGHDLRRRAKQHGDPDGCDLSQ